MITPVDLLILLAAIFTIAKVVECLIALDCHSRLLKPPYDPREYFGDLISVPTEESGERPATDSQRESSIIGTVVTGQTLRLFAEFNTKDPKKRIEITGEYGLRLSVRTLNQHQTVRESALWMTDYISPKEMKGLITTHESKFDFEISLPGRVCQLPYIHPYKVPCVLTCTQDRGTVIVKRFQVDISLDIYRDWIGQTQK
jgi:hypothetical protein